MPFNGAGIFSRTPGTRIANQGPLVSAQVNDETDNLVLGINGKVNLDGLLTYTGLHTLFGDGTALLHQASVRQVQNGVSSHATAVGGTVDAIQLTMSPANTTLTTNEKVRWKSAGANTIVAPTLSKDGGVTNKTIKKGASAALAVGDLGASGQENEATYNGTDWILTNTQSAGSSLSAASTTDVLTGTDTAKYVTADANAALWEKGTDIASAGTISVGEGGTFDVTGTTSITDIDPATDKAGRRFSLVHEGIHTLTHNASTMINLTGANIVTAVGDISTWQSEGSDVVRMIGYSRADGTALVTSGGDAWSLIGTLSTASGATVTQALGATYKQIRAVGSGVSSSGSFANMRVQITDDGTNYGTAIAIAVQNAAAGDSCGWLMDIFNTGVAATTKQITSVSSNNAGVGGGFFGAEATENGITHSVRFSPGAGNFDAGSIAVYGKS